MGAFVATDIIAFVVELVVVADIDADIEYIH